MLRATIVTFMLLAAAVPAGSQEPRRVLLLEYTAISCGPCAVAARAAKRLEDQAGDSLTVIGVHYYDGFKVPAAESLAALYHVAATPTAWFDGVRQELYSDTMTYWNYRTAFSKCSDVLPVLGLALDGGYDRSTRSGAVSCTVSNQQNDPVWTVLRVALVERSVYAPWGGGDSLYEVLRDMVPSFSGITCTLAPKQDSAFVVPFQLDPSWDETKMAVAAWAQDSGGHFSDSSAAVLQSARLELASVTGTAQQPAPALAPPEPSLAIYPNPFRGDATVSYQLPRAGRVTVAVYNLSGQRVATLYDDDQATGRHALRWRASDGQGRPLSPGVYFVRVHDDKTTMYHTVTILH